MGRFFASFVLNDLWLPLSRILRRSVGHEALLLMHDLAFEEGPEHLCLVDLIWRHVE